MKVVYFTHSLLSCWNHGNAHFLRGVARELLARGHDVAIHEPADAWSLQNLLTDHGQAGLNAFCAAYPELRSIRDELVEEACDGADLVIVHEWNDPDLVARIGRLRRAARFTLLFHDTHHRAVSNPDALAQFELDHYDGVLAFGATLAEIYRCLGWGDRAYVWHEAADVSLFNPAAAPQPRTGLVWIGNWGDGEREAELQDYLFRPACEAGMAVNVFGVRYPPHALAMLGAHGASYHGWLANAAAPAVFARHLASVHVPRRFYATQLPGIPTIRVFEALACGIPLLSAPWQDSESLFRPGDFLTAADGEAMRDAMVAVREDSGLRETLAQNGLETVRARHTCAHRVDELLAIVRTIHADTNLAIAR